MGLFRKLVVLIFVLAAIGGSGFLAYQQGVIQEPTFGVEDRGDWGQVTEKQANIITTLWIDNPNPVGIDVGGVRATYTLRMNGIRLATGEKQGLSVPPDNSTVQITTTLLQQNIPQWWTTHLKQGETSQLQVNANAYISVGPLTASPPVPTHTDTIKTNITGMTEGALNEMEGRYEGPKIGVARGPVNKTHQPEVVVNETQVEWGEVTPQESPLIVTVTVHNPNDYPLPTPAFTGNVTMNGIETAQWKANEVEVRNAPQDGKLDPHETRNLTFIARIQTQTIDEWLTSHIQRHEQTEFVVNAHLAVTYNDVTFAIPQSGGLHCRANMTTAILVDDQSNNATFKSCGVGPYNLTAEEATQLQSLSDTSQNTVDNVTQRAQNKSGEAEETVHNKSENAKDTFQENKNKTNTSLGSSETTTETTTQTATTTSSTTTKESQPNAKSTAKPKEGKVPLEVEFDASNSTDPDGNIQRYIWRFDDGSPPREGKVIEHTFTSEGTYEVKLVVVDGDGNRDSTTVTVTVNR